MFYNSEAFVSHIHGIRVFTPGWLVQASIHLCLCNEALDWYNTELSDAERKNLRDLPLENENCWLNQINLRFGLSPTMAMSYLRYMELGAPPCVTACNIVRNARAAGVSDTHQQLLQIWKIFEKRYPEYTPRLSKPSQTTSLSEFTRNFHTMDQDAHWGTATPITMMF